MPRIRIRAHNRKMMKNHQFLYATTNYLFESSQILYVNMQLKIWNYDNENYTLDTIAFTISTW